jgi:hypothetical protein
MEKMILGTGAFMLSMMTVTLLFSRLMNRRAGNRQK